MLKKSILILTISLGLGVTVLTGCTQEASSISSAKELPAYDGVKETAINYTLPIGSYDSADTAILEHVDMEAGTVTLYNTHAARTYTLRYDGTTYVSDKYGTAMSMAQLTEGTIVNVNFLKTTKQLVDIQISPEAWRYDGVQKYNLAGINSTATIGDKTYALSDGVQVFSDGQVANIENIVAGDMLTISGIGHDIFSIKVENGHGYVRLSNDESLVGGWIEVGSELITQVTDSNMLLAVPEGAYTIHMYKNNESVTQDVVVDRNQEVILDCSEIKEPIVDYGQVKFVISPDSAVLKLDGEIKDKSRPVKTTYGIHEIEISANGYDTLNKYINVGEESAQITINLEESRTYVSDNNTSVPSYPVSDEPIKTTTTTTTKIDKPNPTASGNSVSNNSIDKTNTEQKTQTVSGNENVPANVIRHGKVYIYTSADAQLYYDGVHIDNPQNGLDKTEGSHTITILKDGNTPKSFTIYLYDDGQDVAISFPQT